MAGDPAIGSNSSAITPPALGGPSAIPAQGAGAKVAGAGQAGNATPPQPAAAEPALTAPNLASKAADAHNLAVAAFDEVKAEAQNVSQLGSQGAAPALMSAARNRLYVAIEKAEAAAAANVNIHREVESNAGAAAGQAGAELKRLESEFHAGDLTKLKSVNVAMGISVNLDTQWDDSKTSLLNANGLQNVLKETIADLSLKAVAEKHPNLKVADDAVQQARGDLASFKKNNDGHDRWFGPTIRYPKAPIPEKLLVNVGTATANNRAAWKAALNEASNGDKLLQLESVAGLGRAESADSLKEIVIGEHPNLQGAQDTYDEARARLGDFNRSLEVLGSSSEIPVSGAVDARVQLMAAYQEMYGTYLTARNNANKAGDTVLANYCDAQIKHIADDVQEASKL
jgi:hypothetical protein